MNLQEWKVLLLIVTGVLALFVASPALQRLLVYPETASFTEFWVLGSEHSGSDYPYNLTAGENYRVYLGISNQLGYCGYYDIRVKLRNQSQSAPDSLSRTPSSLPAISSIKVFVANNASWEMPVNFSFDYDYDTGGDQIRFDWLLLNDVSFDINSFSTVRDWDRGGVFFANLVFELWIYDDAGSSFQYHERFVDLKFNMTIPT